MRRVTEETQDEGRFGADKWWNDWFAEQLGDRWQTSGDGIYTYVPDEQLED
jgi:hypothetical protein